MTKANPAMSSPSAASQPPGASPQAAGSGALLRLFGAMLVTRSALLRADLGGAAGRIRSALWLSAVCLIALAMAAIFFSVAILVVFWDSYRLEAAIGLPIVFTVVGIGAGLLSRRSLRAAPHAFEPTLQSLRADREALLQAARTAPGP